MPEALLPLFPLNVVLFPESPLPLHIFEDRYKEMIGESMRDRSEFGVVLATEKGIANVGCTALVDTVLKRYDDGRLDIVVNGRRRFEIQTIDQEREFLRAEVEFYDDEDDELAPLHVREAVVRDAAAMGATDLDVVHPRLSFRVAQAVEDLELRQVVLSLRSENERIRHLASFLPQFAAKRRLTEHIRTIAPKNGHSHHLRTDS